ncbi:MAG: deoxyribonuclease IV [Candidatus Doudnabacteria bacterium]
MKIGCHVSIAGGVINAPERAHELGCETFQIFTRSPQGGKAPELTKEVLAEFKTRMKKYGFKEFVIHAPYFINFGSANNRTFYGSVSVVREELERSSLLGASYLMVHLGSFKDLGKEKGEEQVIKGLKKVLDGYKGKTLFLIEISAGAGEVIGDSFEELSKLVKALKKYKTFGGICFDTQHAFASGYDLRDKKSVKQTFDDFEKKIGLKYLRMSHCNDSKVELGSHKDRHEHIDEGLIGKGGFTEILRFFKGLEKKTKEQKLLILETEHDKVRADIQLLKKIKKEL